jgi:ferredoxin-NADP reductase
VPVNTGRPIVRCYSLFDTPVAPGYRITVKRLAASADRLDLPPGASSNYFHDSVHAGDVLKVRAPAGHFCIDDDPASPAVFVAG